jgi:transcriptional regulator with XRE-family HTH domain
VQGDRLVVRHGWPIPLPPFVTDRSAVPTLRLKHLILRAVDLNDEPVRAYQIAGHLGIHPTTLSEYANGKKQLPWQHRRIIARYFDVPESSLDEVIEDDE